MNYSRSRRWRSKPRLTLGGLLLLAALASQLIGGAANATVRSTKINPINDQSQSATARHNMLVSLAQQEGKLVYLSGSTGPQIPPIVTRFEALYPYIKVTYQQLTVATLTADVQQAVTTNDWTYDIIDETSEYGLIYRQLGGIQPFYTPSETPGKKTDSNWNGPNGTVWGNAWYQTLSAFEYNKNLMPNPPETTAALISPSYAGKITEGDNTTLVQWVATVERDIGGSPEGLSTPKGNAYLASFAADNELKLTGLASGTYQGLVASGQLAACLSCSYATYLQEVAAGAPVGFIPLFNIRNLHWNFVSKNPPDPGAAMLWEDWVTSPAGLNVANAEDLIPLTAKFTVGQEIPNKNQGGSIWPVGEIKGLTPYKFNEYTTDWTALKTQYFGV